MAEDTKSWKGDGAAVFTDCSSDSTFMISNDDKVYALGGNRGGKLGVGDWTDKSKPTQIHAFDKIPISMASSGDVHSLFLTREKHEVYFCGARPEWNLSTIDWGWWNQNVPVRVEYFTHVHAVKIVAGGRSSYVLTEEGILFSFGRNKQGQLGVGHLRSRSSPVRVTFPSDSKIVDMSAGSMHLAALAESGDVYTFGYNEFGQLGRDGDPKRPGRILLPESKKVMKIACASLHTVALVSSNEIYAFGDNEVGSLGNQSSVDQLKPVRIPFFADNPIRSLSLGGAHSFCIEEDGEIVAFGWNDNYQLCFGDRRSRNIPNPLPLNRLAAIGGKERAFDIKCGNGHTIFITADGQCFGVGWKDAFASTLDVKKLRFIMKGVEIGKKDESEAGSEKS